MLRRIAAIVALAALAAAGRVQAETVKKVVGFDAAGGNLLKADAWRPYEKGFDRPKGEEFACDNGADSSVRRGVMQTVVLNQKEPRPIIAAAWSRADGVGGSRDSDYSLYLDLIYADGTPLWGQSAPFTTGTHDWERREVCIFPAKPVKQLSFYMLLRGHSGKAGFRGAELRELRVPPGMMWFDGLPVTPAAAPDKRFIVRDVAAGGDFVSFENGKALGLEIRSETAKPENAYSYNVKLTDTTGKDRAVTLAFTLPVKGGRSRWLGDVRRETPAEPPNEYLSASSFGDVGQGRISRYPFAAVAADDWGHGIGIDMAYPAFFRVGFSAGSGELYIAYDLALAPEKPSVELRFCTFIFQDYWGFRGAVAAYQRLFADAFRCRTPQQGIWMPFYKISKVEGWEDFGFKFKEGNDETAWDDEHNISTFRYTEPMTWWMRMPKGMPRTLEAATVEARRLAEKGDSSAQALLTSGYYDTAGRFVARLRNEPWCDGAVWSMNSAPGIAGAVTDFKNKWSAALREKLYGPGRKGDLDGEYVDSSEGYVTDELDFRRDHFAAVRAPLVFERGTNRPAVFRGLIAYEYVRAIAEDVHAMGKLTMANGTPDRLPWLAPYLDVMGTETDWNPGGKWRPMSDDALMYRRIICGPKPYCFLMNTNFDAFPHELVEKYMKRCLAYGMFPGFFSANASTGHYFSRPDLYNRDRPLFKKYVPLTRRVAEAGWRPIPFARSGDPKVYVEQWGEKLLTVFNDSPERRTATITLESTAPRRPDAFTSKELVRGTPLAWENRKATLTLDGEDIAVIELP